MASSNISRWVSISLFTSCASGAGWFSVSPNVVPLPAAPKRFAEMPVSMLFGVRIVWTRHAPRSSTRVTMSGIRFPVFVVISSRSFAELRSISGVSFVMEAKFTSSSSFTVCAKNLSFCCAFRPSVALS